jgi:acetolactate synthase I/II/III large subunit
MYKSVILLGNGCRYNPKLIEYLSSLGVPVLTTWMGMDLISEDNPVFCGRPGIIGQRAANIIQQKADVLYCFGARLDTGQIAYNYDNYAPSAKKIVYDVDKPELDKLPSTWEKHQVDLTNFKDYPEIVPNLDWLKWSKDLYNKFRLELEDNKFTYSKLDRFIDPFKFMSFLSDICTEDDVLSPGSSGITAEIFMQTFKVKKGQRVTCVSTIGAMGADIPMAIGACLASGKKRTICVTGDGGFMLNAQELEVIQRLKLPIKIFVFNNQGYGSVRVMQTGRFNNKVGCDRESGFTVPELFGIIDSFGLGFSGIESLNKLPPYFDSSYNMVYEVRIDPNYKQFPKVLSPNLKIDPMQDISPKLSNLKELMEWGNV